MKPIERGWQSYRRMVVPPDAPDVQVKECRQAFYAGAAILFEALMLKLDPGEEPNEADMQRMAAIQHELYTFGAEIDKRYLKPREQ